MHLSLRSGPIRPSRTTTFVRRATRDAWAVLQPFSEEGVYVNDLGAEGDDRIRSAYGANYDRLAALKNIYDPTNFFRLNQNIKPQEKALGWAGATA